MKRKNKKMTIIDVNNCPIIREHKKKYCPFCDETHDNCKCKKGCSDDCQEINIKELRKTKKYKKARKW